MRDPFDIGGISVEPGTKAKGTVSVTKTSDGQDMIIPFHVVNGLEDGPVLLLDGCIHGDEPEGPLAILRFINELDPEKIRGTVIGIPAVNVKAFEEMRRGNPRDEHTYDLNRVYPGRENGFLTERLAWTHYTEFLLKADLEIAIHGGGNHSYMCPAMFYAGTEGSLELAKAMGEGWSIVMKSLGNSSPMGAGRSKDIHGITVEIGGTGGAVAWLYDENAKKLEKAFSNVMMHYGMLEGEMKYCEHWYVGHQETILAQGCGIIDPIPDVRVGEYIEKGTPIIRLLNLEGELVQEGTAPCDGIPFGIRTYPSVTTGDWLVFFGNLKKVDRLEIK